MKKDFTLIPRDEIIKRIENHLAMVKQGSVQLRNLKRYGGVNVSFTASTFGYLYQAEALIELLEIWDCGSVGGFDGDAGGLYTLEERLALLKRKCGPA